MLFDLRGSGRRRTVKVVYITLAVCGGLVIFDREYVEPFGSPGGQVVLAVIGGLFAASFAWMHRLTTGGPARRFLPGETRAWIS